MDSLRGEAAEIGIINRRSPEIRRTGSGRNLFEVVGFFVRVSQGCSRLATVGLEGAMPLALEGASGKLGGAKHGFAKR